MTYIALTLLGQSDSQIRSRWPGSLEPPPAESTLRGRIYTSLGVTQPPSLFAGCLDREILTIAKPGDRQLTPFTHQQLEDVLVPLANGQSYTEIAEPLEVPSGIVWERIRRLRRKYQLADETALCTAARLTSQLEMVPDSENLRVPVAEST